MLICTWSASVWYAAIRRVEYGCMDDRSGPACRPAGSQNMENGAPSRDPDPGRVAEHHLDGEQICYRGTLLLTCAEEPCEAEEPREGEEHRPDGKTALHPLVIKVQAENGAGEKQA